MKDFRREEEITEYFRLSIRHPTCHKGLHFINEIILEERDHVSVNITSVLLALIVFLETLPIARHRLTVFLRTSRLSHILLRTRIKDKYKPHLRERVILDILLLHPSYRKLWFSFITHKSFAFY